FHIVVRPVNDPPIAQPQTAYLNEDTPTPITLTGSDVEGDALTYRVTPPAHGTLSGIPPHLMYVPALNYLGPDSFAFIANDGQADSAPGVVGIQIAPVNDAPIAGAELFSPTRVNFAGNTGFMLIAPDNSSGSVICDASASSDVENDPL